MHNSHVQLCQTPAGLIWAMKNSLPLRPVLQTAAKFSWWSSRGGWDPGMYINIWTIWKQWENGKHRDCDCWRTWSQLLWKCVKWSLMSLPVPVQASRRERKEALALYKQLNCLLEQNCGSHFPGLLSLELSTSRRHSCTSFESRLFFMSMWQQMECQDVRSRIQDLKLLRWDTRHCKAHLESDIFMLNRHSY